MAEDEEKNEDVYEDSDDLLDDDEIEPEEEGFMKGYDKAGETKEEESDEPVEE